MIVSHRFKTTFMHIPKNAGTSLKELMIAADPECERTWGYQFLPRHHRFGDSAHMPLVDLTPDRLKAVNSYSSFVILRNPLDRFLSAVIEHMHQHKYRNPRRPAEILAELDSIRIRYDPAYVHFCPQHYFTHIGERQLVDTLFRFEDPDLESQLRAFLTGQGFALDAHPLNRKNRARTEKPELGDDFDMEHFYQLYKRDFDLFGYEPPMQKTFEIDADAERGYDRPIDFSAFDRLHFLNWDFERKF